MSQNTLSYGGSPGYTVPVTITKTGGTVANRFIKYDGSDYAGASDDTAGVALFAADEDGATDCQLTNVVLVDAGAALSTPFQQVECDSSGRVVALSSGVSRGIAIDTAAGAGDKVRVVLALN